MAGRGPQPKDPSTRARRNKTNVSERVIMITPAARPDFPEGMPGLSEDGEPHAWPLETGKWWNMWTEHPLSAEFTASDWSFLLDTAVLHGRFWSGDFSVAAELRLRVAKFGATPEDRARLRVQFAVADKAEDEAAVAKSRPRSQTSTQPKTSKAKAADPRAVLSAVV